jgi:hypothetical protein
MAVGTAATSPTTGSRHARYWLWRPPGILFFAATAFAVFVGLWVSSIQSFGGLHFTMVLWFSLAGIWVARFTGATLTARLRFSLAEWVRWLAVPVILGSVFLLTRTSVPFDVRLSLSRGAMDQAAAEIMAGGSTDRDWIGLYAVERVEQIPNGMRFVVAGGGFIDGWGFAYSTDGAPANVDGNDDYEHLDGNWWIWTDRF